MDDEVRRTPAPRVEVVADAGALAELAATRIVEILSEAIEARGVALLALAGGSTPRATYEVLASRDQALDWSRVHFTWSDERVVSANDAASNVRMARESLLTPLGIEEARIHAPRVSLGAADAARAYEIVLRGLDDDHKPTQIDLVLLGLGDDGHTASLFPGGPELDASDNTLVVASHAPVAPHDRVTFTYALIGAARHALFLVSGENKREALRRVLEGDRALPAARVSMRHGSLVWLVDEAARG